MSVWWTFCSAFLLLMHKESVHSVSWTVKGVVGDDVMLPCSFEQNTQNVFWRNKFGNSVCDIVSKADCQAEDKDYKGRVNIFPSGPNEGNFSILLRNLKGTDAGTYTCHTPSKDSRHEVELRVQEKQTTTEEDNQITTMSTISPNSQSTSKREDCLLMLILGCALLCIITF